MIMSPSLIDVSRRFSAVIPTPNIYSHSDNKQYLDLSNPTKNKFSKWWCRDAAEGQFHFWEMAASFRYAPWICIWESESDQVISLPAAASTATHSHGAASNGSSIFSDWARCLWGEHKLVRNIPLSLAT